MAQDHSYIRCFCEECLEDFYSYIGKDVCPVCEKLAGIQNEKPIEKIKTKRKLEK